MTKQFIYQCSKCGSGVTGKRKFLNGKLRKSFMSYCEKSKQDVRLKLIQS